MRFRGTLPAKIDAQGRIKIPTAHRKVMEESFGPDLYVTSVTGKNACIYPLSEWEQIEAKMMERPRLLPSKQKFLRNTGYYGQQASMDKQGRVSIQPLLRKKADLEEAEVVVIGKLDYIEVWNHESFQKIIEDDPYTEKDDQQLADQDI
jgi:MraZ protein